MQSRVDRLYTIQQNPEFSVLIIGAGINGIGTFRDLALQGIDVVMVDRGDYCSGASAASSHMVHGGIRYLENGEFHLVKEAVGERNRLIENAPHLVKPLPTTFPIFKWFSGLLNAPLKFLGLLERPSERGAIVIKIGMMLYDYYTREQKTVPQHIFHDREKSLALFPDLNPKVLFTGTYYDGAMPSPERLAFEVLQDAVEANPNAIPLNYVRLVSAEGKTVVLEDEMTGTQFSVNPRIVINAAGPWIDLVNGTLGNATHFISGTKGSHLILDHPELRQAIGDNEFFFENDDGRIVLIFPLEDKVMIGTSDIKVDTPVNVSITEEEVGYFFEMVGRVFPGIKLDRSQIVYTISGVRPLQHSENGSAGQMSRNHKVQVSEPGELMDIPVFSLVGGKWTSFRAFSEHAADVVLERMGISRKVSTADMAIGGSKGLPHSNEQTELYLAALAETYPVPLDVLRNLLDRYGTNVKAMLDYSGETAGFPLEKLPAISEGELRYIAATQDIQHLDDLILRRTMLGKLGLITPEALNLISEIVSSELGWSQNKAQQERDRFTNLLRKQHKMNYNSFIGG